MNPPHVPTDEDREKVKGWVGRGLPQRAIARRLGISPNTLTKYYQRELDEGADEANDQVAGKLWEMAMSGHPASVIFWLKARAGWATQQKDEDDKGGSGCKDPDPDV